MTKLDTTKAIDGIWGVVEPYLALERIELDDVELVGSGGGRLLRLVVDAEGGVDLDRLSQVSNDLSRLLDAETEIEGPYRLEVSSPGLERRLRRPRHYQKSVGREVVVKIAGDGAVRTLRGVLAAADDRGFVVRADSGDQPCDYDDVESARTVFRWERAPKPGK
ncbi:MAG: ribosome maturation factor RimP [Acidimicrobiia bacterium]